MFVKLDNNSSFDLAYSKLEVIKAAKKYVLYYKPSQAENKLDDYLIKHYRLNLKLMCLKLLNEVQISTDGHTSMFIDFKTAEARKIARFITYGNTKFFGSRILLKALSILNI